MSSSLISDDVSVATAPARTLLEKILPSDALLAVITPVLLIGLWQVGAEYGWVDTRFFPAPSTILYKAVALSMSGELVNDVGISLFRLIAGFIIGSSVGVIVGLGLGSFRLLRVMFEPILSATYVIPKIAILPLIMLVLGLGEASKIAVVALTTFFVVAINTLAGVRQVEPVLIEAGRNFGARGARMFWHVIMPGALPSIFTGLRLGIGVALTVIIAAEFVAAESGIGYLIWRSWTTLVTEAMFVGIAVIAALGMITSWLLYRIAAIVMPWQAQHVDLAGQGTAES